MSSSHSSGLSYESDENSYEINGQVDPPPVSEYARRLGRAAYQAMLDAEDDGDICIVEKSYVITGTPLNDQSLFFCGLQNLINMERLVSKVRLEALLLIDLYPYLPFCNRRRTKMARQAAAVDQVYTMKTTIQETENDQTPSLSLRIDTRSSLHYRVDLCSIQVKNVFAIQDQKWPTSKLLSVISL
jgi:hypothetical protein